MRYKFKFKCSFAEAIYYTATDTETKETFEFRWITSWSEYWKNLHTGGPAAYEKDIIKNMFHVSARCHETTKEMVNDFRKYKQNDWNNFLDYCEEKMHLAPKIFGLNGPASILIYPR